jgi:hypothetical protein
VFDIPNHASIVFQNSVHIELAFPIWLERVVMSIKQEHNARWEAWGHSNGVSGVQLDEDKAVPGATVGFRLRLEFAKETPLELEDVKDAVGGDQRTRRRGGGIGEQDVFKFVHAGRQDGGALIDLDGIEEVENREVLDREDLVHALNAESALAVEEVRDVGLLESGLLGEAKTGKFPTFNALPQDFTEIILQNFELH